MIQTSYSDLRRRLAHYLDEVVDDQEEIVVKRRDGRDVVLVDAAEYESMKETLRVLTPLENAKRLIAAFEQSDRGEGVEATVEDLRRWVETSEAPPQILGALSARDPHPGA